MSELTSEFNVILDKLEIAIPQFIKSHQEGATFSIPFNRRRHNHVTHTFLPCCSADPRLVFRMKNAAYKDLLSDLRRDAHELVRYIVEVDRLKRHAELGGHASMPTPRESFSSLAALRTAMTKPFVKAEVHSSEAVMSPLPKISIKPERGHTMVIVSDSAFKVPLDSRVLLHENTLYINSKQLNLKELGKLGDNADVKNALLFCLSRFVSPHVSGAFKVKDVPLKTDSQKTSLVSTLLANGALAVSP